MNRAKCYHMKILCKPFLLSLLFTIFFGLYINAQTIYYVTPTGAGNNNGTSWENAMDDPQDAINAVFSEGGGQVWIAAGIYHPGSQRSDYFTMKNNVEIYGGFEGSENYLVQRDWENNLTILSGDIGEAGSEEDNSFQIIKNEYTEENPLESTAILDGIHIRDGYHDEEEESFASGLYNEHASPKIFNCTFSSNGSRTYEINYYNFAYGGAVYNYKSSPLIYNCTFISNSTQSASYSYGGAICNYWESSVDIIKCTFISNAASTSAPYYVHGAYGGAIGNYSSGSVNIINCVFTTNSTYSTYTDYCYGGAIANEGSCLTKVTNCTFANNIATNTGGVYNSQYSSIQVNNSIIWGNTGGDINNSGTITVKNSCIDGGYEGTGNVDANPLFEDILNNNFHLTCFSLCIDSGQDSLLPASIIEDMDGNTRMIGESIDMGAYENQTGMPDYPDNIIYVTPNGSGCGTSWNDAVSDLRMAILRAGQLASTSDFFQVWVESGTYNPGVKQTDHYIMANNVGIYGGFTGNETQLSQRDWENNLTILSGDIGEIGYQLDNSEQIIKNIFTDSTFIDSTAVLDGFIIRDGYHNKYSGYTYASGIYNHYASPSIKNCKFISNTSITLGKSFGGAIYNSFSSPKFTNCLFASNKSESWDNESYGGAIYNFESFTQISSCFFDSNINDGEDNSYGGAIYCENSSMILSNSAFVSNTSISDDESSFGGAVANILGSNLEIINCTFSNNTIGSLGGVYNDDSSSLIVKNSILWENIGEGIINEGDIIILYSCINDSLPGMGNIYSNPDFIDPVTNNYQLSCFSPCINAGSNSIAPETEFDLDGNPRIVGDTIDMGAFEFQDEYPPEYFDDIIYVKYNETGCGTSWEDAAGDLKKVIDRARLLASFGNAIQVWVAEGEYYPGETRPDYFTMYNNVEIYGGFNGTETQLSQRNWINNPTILSGNIGDTSIQTDNSYQVIKNNYNEDTALNSSSIIDGFIITGGYNDSYGHCKGSALHNYYASPLIKNCQFIQNTTATGSFNYSSYGGSIYNSYSSPIIINCKFDSNLATISSTSSNTSYGGAIANYEFSNLTLTNCSFIENIASNGGAISNHANSFCKVINCTFSNNSAGTGGAILNRTDGDLEIINSILWENADENIINEGNIDIQYSRIDAEFSGMGNINDNPMFEDMLNNDFHLSSISPCINTGTPDTTGLNIPYFDLDGNPRFMEDNIDMGCYEFQSGPPPILGIVYVTPSGNGSGASWTDPLGNINEAIDLAWYHAQGSGDTIQIWVAQGTYKPGPEREDFYELRNNVQIYGGFSGTETQISQRDWINNQTILSANIGDISIESDNNYRLFYNDYSSSNPLNSSAILDGFILQDGYCDVSPRIGAAMINKYASPVINNCTFMLNTVIGGTYNPSDGGAVYNIHSSAQINNCSFIDNSAYTESVNDSACGGAIYNIYSTININNSSFYSNIIESGELAFGGAIYNDNSSLKLVNCILNSNTALFSSNALSYGGGIFNHDNSYLELVNCFFSNNIGKNGGAISNQSNSICKITNSTFTGNNANSGGGIHNHYNSDLEVTNSILWANTNANLMNLGEANIQYSCIEEEFTGPGNIVDDPMFEDFINQDFHLSWQSPCISAGTPDTTGLNLPEFDLDGNTRIIGSAVDIGCFEFLYPTDVAKQVINNYIEIYPNPSTDFIKLIFKGDFVVEKIEIIDTYGNSVPKIIFDKGKIDVSNLGKGVYLLKLTTTEKHVNLKKFIKL